MRRETSRGIFSALTDDVEKSGNAPWSLGFGHVAKPCWNENTQRSGNRVGIHVLVGERIVAPVNSHGNTEWALVKFFKNVVNCRWLGSVGKIAAVSVGLLCVVIRARDSARDRITVGRVVENARQSGHMHILWLRVHSFTVFVYQRRALFANVRMIIAFDAV